MDIDGSFVFSSVKSVKTISDKIISFYPNPVKNILTLESTEVDAMYTISDLLGRIIESKSTSHRQTSIRVDQLKNSVYIIQYDGSAGMFIKD